MEYGYRVFDVVLDGTEVNKEFLIDGERIDYNDGSVEITIRLDSQSADAIPLQAKQAIQGSFKRFYLTATVAGTVTIMVSKPANVRIESSQIDIDKINSVEKTDTWTVGPWVSVDNTVGGVLISASDTDRKSVTIKPAGAIWIGSAGVSAANGYPLAANEAITIDHYTGDIYGISAGAAVNVAFIEEGV